LIGKRFGALLNDRHETGWATLRGFLRRQPNAAAEAGRGMT
jgi:hypothetical protein